MKMRCGNTADKNTLIDGLSNFNRGALYYTDASVLNIEMFHSIIKSGFL